MGGSSNRRQSIKTTILCIQLSADMARYECLPIVVFIHFIVDFTQIQIISCTKCPLSANEAIDKKEIPKICFKRAAILKFRYHLSIIFDEY